MEDINLVIHISKDNTKMKSKKTKEEQVICGKTVLDIVEDMAKQYGRVITKEELNTGMDHVVFVSGHAPVMDLDFMLDAMQQYPSDIVLIKDRKEREILIYIPQKIYQNHMEEIKAEWGSFSELLYILEESYRVEELKESVCVESKLDLSIVTKNIQKRINLKIIEDGATLIDVDSTYIDCDVKVGVDTVIYPNTFLKGNTVIGEDCVIGPDSRIEGSVIGNKTTIVDSTVLFSEVANETNVGPYAYVRPNSVIGSNVKVGDFVEIKNSRIGDNTKISHLSYVGDADLGKNVNIGCGVVFVNYDGKNKFRSTVHDDSFIGCNANIVAPVVIENNSYVAAGSTITKDVPAGALAIARVRQENKEGWVQEKK